MNFVRIPAGTPVTAEAFAAAATELECGECAPASSHAVPGAVFTLCEEHAALDEPHSFSCGCDQCAARLAKDEAYTKAYDVLMDAIHDAIEARDEEAYQAACIAFYTFCTAN